MKTYWHEAIHPTAVDEYRNSTNGGTDGLTKREYFAAMAMQGLLSDPELTAKPEVFAHEAVRHADALIVELNKGEL